jgi:hypothetical protein
MYRYILGLGNGGGPSNSGGSNKDPNNGNNNYIHNSNKIKSDDYEESRKKMSISNSIKYLFLIL